MHQDLEREKRKGRCEACDHQQQLEMEKNPAVRELRDKIERLNFRLSECHNENQMLKRNLNLAKQVMYKESGEDAGEFKTLNKHGTETGSKGRMETILQLSTQVQELQNHLKQLEGESPVPPEPVLDSVRNRLTSERKVFWRMELERRKARENAVNEMSPVIKECTVLRKKLDDEKSRFKELNKEVNLLRKELHSKIEKHEEDMGLVKSYQTLENQLQETQSEISETRDALVGFKARNETLSSEISSLKEEIRILQDKTKDSNALIDSLTGKHKQIQETIEAEKVLVQQHANRYKEELAEMMDNCKEIREMFDNIQSITHEKVNMVRDLENLVNIGISQKQDDVDKSKPTTVSLDSSKVEPEVDGKEEGKDGGKDEGKEKVKGKDKEKEKGKGKENGKEDKSPSNAEFVESTGVESSPTPKPNPKLQRLMIECAKYKSLIEAANIESDRLSYLTSVQENRLNEVAVEVVETGRLIMQKSQEKKDLLNKVAKLQNALAAKKKVLAVTDKEVALDLNLKIQAQKEKNEFLRHFLKVTLENQVQDMYLYKSFVADTKSYFEKALEKVKGELPKASESKNNADTGENKDLGTNE